MEKQFTMEYATKIEEVLKDEKVLEALAGASGKEEIVAIFAQQGVELDEDIAQDVYVKVRNISETGELDAEMLDAVSGGFIETLGAIAMIAAGVVTFYITVKVGCWLVRKLVK